MHTTHPFVFAVWIMSMVMMVGGALCFSMIKCEACAKSSPHPECCAGAYDPSLHNFPREENMGVCRESEDPSRPTTIVSKSRYGTPHAGPLVEDMHTQAIAALTVMIIFGMVLYCLASMIYLLWLLLIMFGAVLRCIVSLSRPV